ncbi:MAG: protease/peptidase, partial [Bacteroidota bacterium]
VIFIGEKSYGFLTANDMFELPFDTKAALTTSYIADKNNKYDPYIMPDVEIIKQDNFEDLTKDGNVLKAMEFFKAKEE